MYADTEPNHLMNLLGPLCCKALVTCCHVVKFYNKVYQSSETLFLAPSSPYNTVYCVERFKSRNKWPYCTIGVPFFSGRDNVLLTGFLVEQFSLLLLLLLLYYYYYYLLFIIIIIIIINYHSLLFWCQWLIIFENKVLDRE